MKSIVLLVLFAVVAVLSQPSGPTPSDDSRTVTIILTNRGFRPSIVDIQVGDCVTFVNRDRQSHDVTGADFEFSLHASETYTLCFNESGSFSFNGTAGDFQVWSSNTDGPAGKVGKIPPPPPTFTPGPVPDPMNDTDVDEDEESDPTPPGKPGKLQKGAKPGKPGKWISNSNDTDPTPPGKWSTSDTSDDDVEGNADKRFKGGKKGKGRKGKNSWSGVINVHDDEDDENRPQPPTPDMPPMMIPDGQPLPEPEQKVGFSTFLPHDASTAALAFAVVGVVAFAALAVGAAISKKRALSSTSESSRLLKNNMPYTV